MKHHLLWFFMVIYALQPAFSQCWQQVSSGANHIIAIKTDGTLWAWGNNSNGQLGNGSNVESKTPFKIGIANDWAHVAAAQSGDQSFAIKNNGTLWAWGDNFYGQLGDGTGTDRTIPTQIGAATDWKMLAPGLFHTYALKTDGTIWSWGRDVNGQLGDGGVINANRLTPSQIGTDFITIAAGDAHGLAIKTDGTLWAWGFNLFGQLGNGQNTDKNAPFLIGTDTDWGQVAGGDGHSIALKTNGTLYTWGANDRLQLGQGTSGPGTNTNIPKQVGTATDWEKIGAGEYHSFAIKTGGDLYSWGENSYGQVGIGTNGPGTNQNVPVLVNTATDWISVDGGRQHSIAIRRGNITFTWGRGSFGALGNGGNADATRPTPVSCGSPFTIWNGSISTQWADPANWTPDILPGANSNVFIPSGMPNNPVLSASTAIKSLMLGTGVTITLVNGAILTINGQ